MAHLSLALLGPFRAALDGQAITGFESVKARALLAYLAVEADRPHARETLAGLLWPDSPNQAALTALRHTLASLRKTLGDPQAESPFLLVTRETVQFNTASNYTLDLTGCANLRLAENLEPKAPCGSGLAVERLEQAITAYRGSLLEGFSCDSAPFEEWLVAKREQINQQVLDALTRLVKHYEQHGDHARAITYARQQLELEPWDESAHQALMRALALSGQRSAALAQYDTCRHLLQHELQVQPAPETVALYERIQAGELAPVSTGLPTAPSGPPQPNLPTWLTPFVGRQALLAEIRDRLGDLACRLLTLVGPGGCGKTRLAVEAAGQATAFADGVYLVSLASLQSADAIVPAVALALGFAFQQQPSPRKQLLDYLRQKTMLIILDNFEHLMEGAALVVEMLQTAPRLKVMVTSRVALNVQGEQLLLIPGLEYPMAAPTNWAEALEYSGVQLYVQSARRVYPAFEPTGQDLAPVVEICRLVEGMPLGLLLAAAWMRLLTPAEIAAQIASHSLDFLESDGLDMPARQRSLRAVFDHSWRLLSEREQNILAGLAVFRGGLTYPAAQQVTGATLRDLIKLVNGSLLDRTTTGRYTMHELLRQYAKEKLNGLPDSGQGVRDRHADYYVAALQRWTAEIKGPRQQDALAEMDVELDNILAAWNWVIERGQVMRLADRMEALDWYCEWRMRFQIAELAFHRAEQALAVGGPSQSPERLRAWACALYVQGSWEHKLGRPESAQERLRQSLELLDRVEQTGRDVRRDRASALYRVGAIQYISGAQQDARATFTASLSLCRELQEPRAMAIVLEGLGSIAHSLGDYAEAARCMRECLSIHRVLGIQREVIGLQQELAWALGHMGASEEAERLLQENVALCRRAGDQAALTWGIYFLGANLIWDGRYAESLALLEECVEILDRLGNHFMLARALNQLGGVNAHLGHYDRAHTNWEMSRALFHKVSCRWGQGIAISHLGGLALAEGEWAEAGELARAGVVALREAGLRSLLSRALSIQGNAALRLGDLDLARTSLAETLRNTVEVRDFITALHVLPNAAVFAAETANTARGVELYALALRHPFIANSVLWRDMVGQHIAARAKTLPARVVTAAEKRGQDRELWATLEELQAEFEERLAE